MAYARALRLCGVFAVCGTLLFGCTDGGSGGEGTTGAATPKANRSGGGADAGPGPGAGPSGEDTGARPTPSLTAGTDPAKQPRTAEQARALIRKVIADPELFGPGVVRATPYESDPSRWAVLGEDCVWRQQELSQNVLATLTRHFEVPAGDGKGSMRLSATVTVHRTALDAAWEQARMLEEALGCEQQVLRPGENLTSLFSSGDRLGEGANTSYDDWLTEDGECRSDTRGGPYPYHWQQVRLGPVVVAASACGGRGHTDEDVWEPVGAAHAKVSTRVQQEIGWNAGAASGSPEPDGSPSAAAPGTKGGA